MKRLTALVLITVLAAGCLTGLGGCGAKSGGKATLTIAYQYGMAYAPLLVMKEQGLIEKHYGSDVELTWQVLNSGAAINEGVVSGSIDVGAMGVGPAVTGVMKGIPYKIFAALSSQPHAIMTNDPAIQSLSDIGPETKIALVNIGSIQHILLAMAAESELGDARALDNNIVAMSHPDGMTALISGAADCQLTTSPYLFYEAEEPALHKISSIENVWPNGNSFIVGLASTKLHDENPALYQALVSAMEEATAFIENQPDEAAALLAPYQEVAPETMRAWLSDPACGYGTALVGVMQMADFMAREGFIPEGPASIADLAYDNVQGD